MGCIIFFLKKKIISWGVCRCINLEDNVYIIFSVLVIGGGLRGVGFGA